MMEVLLDTNVPLNLWLDDRGSVAESTAVMDAVAKGKVKGYLTPTILNNLLFVLHKSLPRAEARSLAKGLLAITAVIPQDKVVFNLAISSDWKDVEDASQYFAAKATGIITHICTCNGKDFKKAEGIEVVSPAELLRSI
jgi:predicted nucleic acid-binding protein